MGFFSLGSDTKYQGYQQCSSFGFKDLSSFRAQPGSARLWALGWRRLEVLFVVGGGGLGKTGPAPLKT